MSTVSLPVVQLVRRSDARQLDGKVVSAMADSIAAIGLLNPVRVRKAGDEYEVIAGAHRLSITQACSFHGTASIACRWLDSARVARRAWPQFAGSGYGLANIAREFGISFQHHDALEDARAAAHILQRALDESGQDLEFWFDRVEKSLSGAAKGAPIRRTGDGDGPLVGQTIVFTGALSVPRKAAADLAHVAGAAVEPSVNKSTTMLVVGDQDITRLAGASKSSKHRKVETMIEKGAQIMIVGETDFMAMVQ